MRRAIQRASQAVCNPATWEAACGEASTSGSQGAAWRSAAQPYRCMSFAPQRTSVNSSGLRRVSRPSSMAVAEAEAAADGVQGAGAAAAGPMLGEMSKEVPGGTKPLATWEKWYWGGGVLSVAFLLYKYMSYKPPKTPEELEAARQAKIELQEARKAFVREALMTHNFVRGERDPLDGLSPSQIEKFMEEAGVDETDPLEGMTPEEIDAYMEALAAANPPDD